MSTTCLHCGKPLLQSGRGRPKEFCDKSCGDTYRNRLKGHRAWPERHVLTEVDEHGRTGTCSVCGPGTKIWKGGSSRRRWRCATRVGGQASRRNHADRDRYRERKWFDRGIRDFTVAQFDEMLLEQEGRCALCRGEMRQIAVDHCHDTGRVRGLLCSTCNTGLGKFDDDPAKLQAAIDYLTGGAPTLRVV